MNDRGQPHRRWEIDDVLARTDLARLLDELAQPATHAVRGRRWHCPVPDHPDHRASVTMHTDHRGHERWRCWSGDDTHRGDAIDLEGNIYNNAPAVGRMLTKMAASAQRVYVVADSSKIGRTALMRFGRIGSWDGLITDRELKPTMARALRRARVQLIQTPGVKDSLP